MELDETTVTFPQSDSAKVTSTVEAETLGTKFGMSTYNSICVPF